jgi:hypothetical protein
VAAQLKSFIPSTAANFLVLAGDNFYPAGVDSTDDPQWDSSYRSVYSDSVFNLPWWIIAGNHDWKPLDGPQAELDYYTQKLDARWNFPSLNYSQTWPLSNNKTLQIVFVDTQTMCEECAIEQLDREIEKGEATPLDADIFRRQFPLRKRLGADQWTWIESTLANSTADWIVVVGHFGVFSGGEHGNQDTLVQRLKPMMDQYNVDAYVAGHDHILQHLQSDSVHYWGSGAGAKLGTYTAIPQSVFGAVANGFMLHSIDGDNMTVNIIDSTGATIYSYVQMRRAKPHDA